MHVDVNRMRDRMFGSAPVGTLPSRSVRRVPSDFFLWAAAGSVLLSAALRALGRRDDSLFVGEWAPTFLGLGVLSRLQRVI